MLASLLRPRKGRRARRPEPSPFSSPLLQRHDGQNPDRDYFRNDHGSQDEDDYDGGGEDEDDDNDPILPIFSAEHLGMSHPHLRHRCAKYHSGATAHGNLGQSGASGRDGFNFPCVCLSLLSQRFPTSVHAVRPAHANESLDPQTASRSTA